MCQYGVAMCCEQLTHNVQQTGTSLLVHCGVIPEGARVGPRQLGNK